MNEPEKIDPRELSPLALAFVGDSVLELLVRQRLVEHHRLSAGKLNAEKVKYVSARAQFREEQLLEPLFTEDELAVFKRGRNASCLKHCGSSSTPTKNKNAKARCFPHWKTVPEGSGLCDLRKIRGSRPWSIRREGQRQRLFLALLERLLVEFLALSSSAPLVYWLGCLCSLVALLVVWLDVRFEV